MLIVTNSGRSHQNYLQHPAPLVLVPRWYLQRSFLAHSSQVPDAESLQ